MALCEQKASFSAMWNSIHCAGRRKRSEARRGATHPPEAAYAGRPHGVRTKSISSADSRIIRAALREMAWECGLPCSTRIGMSLAAIEPTAPSPLAESDHEIRDPDAA